MTSRRQFFGLLAAAPLVAPAIAKEMASAMAAPKYAMGGYVRGFSTSPRESIGYFESSALRFLHVSEAHTPLVEMLTPPDEWISSPFDGKPRPRPHHDHFHAIPNRLYGAQINADGDAV